MRITGQHGGKGFPVHEWSLLLPQTSSGVVEEEIFQARFGYVYVAEFCAFRLRCGHNGRDQRSPAISIKVRACALDFYLAHTGKFFQTPHNSVWRCAET